MPIIIVEKEFRIPGTNIILEKGDKISINEKSSTSEHIQGIKHWLDGLEEMINYNNMSGAKKLAKDIISSVNALVKG